jgi:23S rRNA (guanosine2251-2'-O)-methyltransferase
LTQIEGRNPVREALRKGTLTLIKIEKGKENENKIKQIINQAKKTRVKVELVTRQHMNNISVTKHHQGVIGVGQEKTMKTLDQILRETREDLCILLLDRLQDPQNLGAILRTCEASGVNGVVITKKGSVDVTPTVYRVSMGGSLWVPVWKKSLFPVVKKLREEDVKLVGLDSTADKLYYEEDLTSAVAFVIGGEHSGVSPTLLSKCDTVVRIPMKGKVNSLNVSTATAIVLYERLRQRDLNK